MALTQREKLIKSHDLLQCIATSNNDTNPKKKRNPSSHGTLTINGKTKTSSQITVTPKKKKLVNKDRDYGANKKIKNSLRTEMTGYEDEYEDENEIETDEEINNQNGFDILF